MEDGAHQDAGEQGEGETVGASPPNSRGPTVNRVVPEVIMVRLKVALMATSEQSWIPIWVRELSKSRKRSEMTMLSLRVADHRHQTGDDVEVELDVEQRQQPQRHQTVVQHRHQDADGLAPLEAPPGRRRWQAGHQHRQHPLLEQPAPT